MAFQVSPGVNVSEIDLTTSIPAVSVSTGAIAGNFRWGPIEKVVSVSSENELASRFGSPDNDTAVSFLTASSFLAYSNDLLVVRASDSANVKNAVAAANTALTPTPILVKNEDEYFDTIYVTGAADSNTAFVARYAGELGSTLKVSVCPSTNAFALWEFADLFDNPPSTSPFVANKGGSNDELHIVVLDEDGLVTGVANTVLERYSNVSKASDAKTEDGTSNYYKEVLFAKSQYVLWANHLEEASTNWGTPSSGTTYGAAENALTVSFVGGAKVQVPALALAYDELANAESVDLSLLIGGGAEATVSGALIDIAASRKDCVAFVSPPLNATLLGVSDIVTYAKSTLNKATSYAVMDSGWKYMYDKYNDVYRWVPLNGDTAGVCARTDNERAPWFSPAGFQRGQIRNVVRLAINPNQTERDNLYKAGINPVVSFPGEGTVLFGDKTLLGRPSAFDRINVRRLFIVLEKAIARASRSSLFEFNDEFTRAQFVSLVEPFLRTVQGRRGIFDFRVVCDETNNTTDIIDRNEFVGDIYIKPARSINFIQLNFVAVRTGVAFEEIVGGF